ncbi:hypothetical protein [Bartonella sp. TP]|uniref:hypothetical protein n=1 Tax=Bartonella sp. TP TaxID=3057550 RepID=UPI0025B01FB6|nr:hypothetical protein [Bartonella sp. TP]MDN5249333.1 hypothetical protein [Alphaproteobacteria bacterium]WJW80505.1 hypothetical protein QVL57_02765 [Bartonella sp. TP]
MKYKLYNCSSWSLARLLRYKEQLSQAMEKLARRFPGDIAVLDILQDITSGRHEMWLILDEQEEFIAFLTTELKLTLEGKKRLNLCQLGGRGGTVLAQFLPQLEQYGRDHGASEICPVGRIGWLRVLGQLGYKPEILKYRKDLTHG